MGVVPTSNWNITQIGLELDPNQIQFEFGLGPISTETTQAKSDLEHS